MQLVFTEHSKVKQVIYAVSQTICNRFVLSAVSFQINLWQSPSYTDCFSWVFFFPPFWNLVPVGHATWNSLDWSCYLCRRALVPPLGCAPWACPTSPSLHRSHCWSLGASWGPAITRAQITAVGRPPLCCWLWTLSLWLTDNHVPHTQPHDSFIFAHFSFWHFYVCEYIKKKVDQME